jgi:integrase/recombinase XerD
MRPKGTTRAKKPIGKKEFDRLIDALAKSRTIKSPTRAKLTRGFTLLYMTGCRVSEIAHLHSDDLQRMVRDNEYSLTNATKTKRSRLISFDSEGVQAERLRQLLPKLPGHLFARNGSDKPMTASALTQLMNGFIHRVLGELYSTHSFRAGYVTEAHRLGFSLEHIRQDIGHKNISTTARYATVTNEEISHGKTKRKW